MKSMLQILNDQISSPTRTSLVVKRWEEQGIHGPSRDIYWRHLPSTEKFYTELNASFVVEYSSIHAMATFPVIMLRDGYFGLLYFFLKNPKPIDNFNTIILIPSKFEYLIPKGWGENTLLYEFDYLNNRTDTTTGIFTGIPSKENFLNETAAEKLKNSFNDDMIIHSNVYGKDRFIALYQNQQNYYNDYKKELYRKFGFNIHDHTEYKPLDWGKVDETYSFFNIDSDHFLIYSDFLNFSFASKGATFINKPKLLIDDPLLKLDVSPYHQLRVGNHSKLSDKVLQSLIKMRLSSIPAILHHDLFYEFALSQFNLTLRNQKEN